MCMPTNFASRKKHTSSFRRTQKKSIQNDDFFKDSDKFLNSPPKKQNENSSFKS